MKSFKQVVSNKVDLTVKLKHKSIPSIIIEGADPFNIAIVNPKDFELIPNTPSADIGELSKLLKKFSYLNSVPMAAQPSGKKFKLRTKVDAEQAKVREWIKDNAPALKPYVTFGSGSIGSSGGVKIHENTQELMVACLVLLGKKYGTVKHPDTNILIRN